MILEIHGGPHSAYGNTYTHEFMWMAAKGYVVLFTNPRGSTSYGQDFGNIIQYHYPGDDYKDLMAGVDEVVKRGYVDPARLGVTGGSGGGLLTNWTITQTQRFKAAVSQRDIADWYGFWFTADFTQFQPTLVPKGALGGSAGLRRPFADHARRQRHDAADARARRSGLSDAAGRWWRDDVPRAEVPEDSDRDGQVPARESRALPIGRAVASRRAPAAHRRLDGQVAPG